VVTGAGSYLRHCITELKAQEPFRTCNESKEEEEEGLEPLAELRTRIVSQPRFYAESL